MKRLLLLAFLLISACTPEKKAEIVSTEHHSSKLIEVEKLQAVLGKDTQLKVIDMRAEEDYNKGHIPGALRVFRNDIEDPNHAVKGMMAPKAQMEALMGRLGILPTDFVVIYDAKGNPDAGRMWWLLDYYGHANKALLNGGLLAWQGKGMQMSQESPTPQAVAYQFPATENKARYASIEDVKNALSDTNYVIVDTRTTAEYEGTEPLGKYKRVGRIPGSISVNHELNINFNQQGVFKSVEELKELYKSVPPNKKIICYCKSGVRSAMATYVLTEVLGYQNVQNYDGSWLEWNVHEELPIKSGL